MLRRDGDPILADLAHDCTDLDQICFHQTQRSGRENELIGGRLS